MGRSSLPPGFRFHPTDVELVMYYLKRKVMGQKIFEVISELDIYKFVPQDLPDKSCLKSRDLEWYFFCPREKKYGSGGRMNRTTEFGYWKTTGKDRQVVYKDRTVGQIRTLIFHHGRTPRGNRTNWVMYEYRLEDEVLADSGIDQDVFVLCKIFQKSGPGPKNGAQYGAPFNEEDWNDEDESDHIESLPFSCMSAPATVLNDNQSISILRGVVGLGDAPSGFPSTNSGPSQTLPSADKVLPSVPDDDIPELPPDDELLSMLEIFREDDNLVSNENDENEVDKPSDAQNVEDALPLEINDIYKDLEDLGNLAGTNGEGFNFSSSHKAKHSLDEWPPTDPFLELSDLDSPLKIPVEGSGSGFVPPGSVCMDYDCCNNSEHFDRPFNDFGVMHHSYASSPYPSVLVDRSNGFENRMDAFPKKCVGENNKRGYLGYESALYITEQSEPDSGHAAQTHKRGKYQTKSYSRFQQVLESIPGRPASAAEHPGSSNGLRNNTRTVLWPSVGVGECTEEALAHKLEELSCLGYCGCNLNRRRELRKEAAVWDGNFMFVLFLGMLSALMWVFVAAIIMKLGRCAWDFLLS